MIAPQVVLPAGIPVRVEVPSETVELSVVMPCLNEARTLEGCIRAAAEAIRVHGLSAEIIVADNGSTDGSQEIARRCGARVVDVRSRGYGNALKGGFAAARGKYLLMGDSDLSYDFGDAMKFVAKLREGYDLVMGNRFDRRGGGGVQPGAMPLKNRYLGNPVLTWIGRVLFRCPVSDFHCGIRAFTREAYQRMGVRSAGMEFASEIVVKAALRGMRITEVPVRLRKDGRGAPPHLRPWRDGWRHLRFMLSLSPRWTMFLPGLALLIAGLVIGGAVAVRPVRVAGVWFDVHTLVGACLLVLVGYQWVATALVMRCYGLAGEIGPPRAALGRWVRLMSLERSLALGALLILAGAAAMAWVIVLWARSGFGELEAHTTIRPMLLGATGVAMGVQTVLIAWVAAMLQVRRGAEGGA